LATFNLREVEIVVKRNPTLKRHFISDGGPVVAQSARYVLVSILAVVGALYLGYLALSWALSPNYSSVPDDTKAYRIPAPDGAYKAVNFLSVGGGGLAPYCTQIVGVVAATQPDASALVPSNRVLIADCHNGVGIIADKAIEWKSDNDLQISLDVTKVIDLHLKGYIYFKERGIFIRYVDRPKG
jgi:hypothetical protein